MIRQGIHFRSGEDVQNSSKCSLNQSVVGKGLMEHDGFKPHGFLMNSSRLLSGSIFVPVLKLRGYLLRTRGESARVQSSPYFTVNVVNTFIETWALSCRFARVGMVLELCNMTKSST